MSIELNANAPQYDYRYNFIIQFTKYKVEMEFVKDNKLGLRIIRPIFQAEAIA